MGIPEQYRWHTLKTKKGAELEVLYVELLRALGTQKGMLGQIFTKAQNKIQDPAKLYRLIDMVDSTQWVMMGKPLDKRSLVLRLPHQCAPHAEEKAPALRGHGRFYRLLQSCKPAETRRNLESRHQP